MRGLYGRRGRDSIPSQGIERPARRRTLPAMFTVHTTQSAPEGSREALAALERNIGFIPNLAAHDRRLPDRAAGLRRAADRAARQPPDARSSARSSASPSAASTSSAYSLAAHSAFAAGAGGSPEVVAALRAGEPLGDERLDRPARVHRGAARSRGDVRGRTRRRGGARGDRPDRLHDAREPRGQRRAHADRRRVRPSGGVDAARPGCRIPLLRSTRQPQATDSEPREHKANSRG